MSAYKQKYLNCKIRKCIKEYNQGARYNHFNMGIVEVHIKASDVARRMNARCGENKFTERTQTNFIVWKIKETKA